MNTIEILDRAIAKGRKAEEQLRQRQTTCKHDWSPPKYDPEIIPAQATIGDNPSTRGIDYRPSIYVSEQRKDRWTRQCANCKLKQETIQADPPSKEKWIPRFS